VLAGPDGRVLLGGVNGRYPPPLFTGPVVRLFPNPDGLDERPALLVGALNGRYPPLWAARLPLVAGVFERAVLLLPRDVLPRDSYGL